MNLRLLHFQWLELELFCGTLISKNISYYYMSIYTGNDLEDRLEALEAENASLKNTMNTIRWYIKLIICQTYM